MNHVSKKTYILTIIVMVMLSLFGLVGGYFYGGASVRGDSQKQYLLLEDVDAGHSLKGKYQEVYVANNSTISMSNLLLNANDIDNSVATIKMYKNAPISVTSVTKIDDVGRDLEVSFPVTVAGSIANSIKPGDYVAVKVTYEDSNKEDGVVISRIKVKDIRSSNGAPITDETMVVGFIILDATNLEISDINNALKDGTLYCTKYNNLMEEPLKKTYFVGDAPKVESTAEVTEEKPVE